MSDQTQMKDIDSWNFSTTEDDLKISFSISFARSSSRTQTIIELSAACWSVSTSPYVD